MVFEAIVVVVAAAAGVAVGIDAAATLLAEIVVGDSADRRAGRIVAAAAVDNQAGIGN